MPVVKVAMNESKASCIEREHCKYWMFYIDGRQASQTASQLHSIHPSIQRYPTLRKMAGLSRFQQHSLQECSSGTRLVCRPGRPWLCLAFPPMVCHLSLQDKASDGMIQLLAFNHEGQIATPWDYGQMAMRTYRSTQLSMRNRRRGRFFFHSRISGLSLAELMNLLVDIVLVQTVLF